MSLIFRVACFAIAAYLVLHVLFADWEYFTARARRHRRAKRVIRKKLRAR